MLDKQTKRYRRHNRIRSKVQGTAKVPRLCVFRSAKHIYAQLIDDEKGKTILQAKDFEIKKAPAFAKASAGKSTGAKVELAKEVGKLIANKAEEKKITEVKFDRGGYKYHGRVKALADAAREAGLKF